MDHKEDFFVVGIGASAGGLEAIFDFFSHVPENPRVAFIIIRHLKMDNVTYLPQLLKKYTSLHIIDVKGGEQVQPNCIYLMPENKFLTIKNKILHLSERAADEKINKAIDRFFISLAQDMKDKAIAIILSGTGSDGVNGVKEIEHYGGIVIAQDPDSAAFKSMPQNTIWQDHPDYILSPDQMPGYIMEYVNHHNYQRRAL